MANFKNGQSENYKYLDTCWNILLQEMLMYNMKDLALTVQKLLARLKFWKKKWVKLQGQSHSVKNNGTHEKVLSLGIT